MMSFTSNEVAAAVTDSPSIESTRNQQQQALSSDHANQLQKEVDTESINTELSRDVCTVTKGLININSCCSQHYSCRSIAYPLQSKSFLSRESKRIESKSKSKHQLNLGSINRTQSSENDVQNPEFLCIEHSSSQRRKATSSFIRKEARKG